MLRGGVREGISIIVVLPPCETRIFVVLTDMKKWDILVHEHALMDSKFHFNAILS